MKQDETSTVCIVQLPKCTQLVMIIHFVSYSMCLHGFPCCTPYPHNSRFTNQFAPHLWLLVDSSWVNPAHGETVQASDSPGCSRSNLPTGSMPINDTLIDFTWKRRHSNVTWCRPMTNGKGLVDRWIKVLSISRSSTCHLKRDPSTDTCSMGWIARRTSAIYLGILRSFAACIC